MKISINEIIKELKNIDKLQNKAIKEEDNLLLAACFIKLAKMFLVALVTPQVVLLFLKCYFICLSSVQKS